MNSLDTYRNTEDLDIIRRNAMSVRMSWDDAVKEYQAVYDAVQRPVPLY